MDGLVGTWRLRVYVSGGLAFVDKLVVRRC